MPLRDIELQADLNEMTGGEDWELWLKPDGGAWALHSSGVVDTGDPTPVFPINGLDSTKNYTVQLRASREGRYRPGYLNADPDSWPAQSRLVFRPGAAAPAAPTITGWSWARTSGVAQAITITVTPNPAHMALDLELLRGGVVVATVAGPHAGPVAMVDTNPPAGASHSYEARHTEFTLPGTSSAPTAVWAGPAAPTGLVQMSTGGIFYEYGLEWDAPAAGAATRIEDDYLCTTMGTFSAQAVTAADAIAEAGISVQKDSSHASNGNVPAAFTARARHEVVSFGVTDVSAWATTPVAIEIANDETAFNSCP